MTATAAPWSLLDPVLRVREQGVALATGDLVDAVDPAAWAELGLTVRRGPDDRQWTVAASQYAGVARIQAGRRPVHIEIAPKIDGLDLFFLADWAYSATGAAHRATPAQLEVLRPDPAACLLGWYLQSLTDFATRWLRRGYVSREERLHGRVRGRILVGPYLRESVALARGHIVPCRYVEPTHDTALNQFLKVGLRRALALAPALPVPGARQHLQRLGNRALALFHPVSDVRATAHDANRINPTGPDRHYRPLVDLTRSILAGTYLSPTSGQQLHDALLYDSNLLFQEALRNILTAWPGGVLERKRPQARLVDPANVVIRRQAVLPDYVLTTPDGRTLLLDAKYTEVFTQAPGGDDMTFGIGRQRLRVRRSEVYQAVSYSQHDSWRPAPAALVYPVSLATGAALPLPHHVLGFGAPIHLLFLDVGPRAHDHIADFYAALDATFHKLGPGSSTPTSA